MKTEASIARSDHKHGDHCSLAACCTEEPPSHHPWDGNYSKDTVERHEVSIQNEELGTNLMLLMASVSASFTAWTARGL